MKKKLNKIYHTDNAKFTPQIPDGSLDVILEDPPYLYLKNQKLDRPFDELAHFTECYRMLRKGGFIVIFGRGESFYRWNTILADLGFVFKEEIIWNKRRISSPSTRLGRVHETISIWAKGKGSVNKVLVNYGELKAYDKDKVYEDIKRLGGLFNKGKAYENVIKNLKKVDKGECYSHGVKNATMKVTFSSPNILKCVSTYTLLALENGVREQSIISDNSGHYGMVHPTQKPQRLLERLLALVLPQDKPKEKIVVADFFGGSCNTARACIALGVNYIITEIDKDYFDLGVENVEKFKEEFQFKLFD